MVDVQRFSALFNALAPVVLELDEKGHITHAVGDASRLLGAGARKLEGLESVDFVYDKDLPFWSLITHRLKRISRLGPVTLRMRRDVRATVAVQQAHASGRRDQAIGKIAVNLFRPAC